MNTNVHDNEDEMLAFIEEQERNEALYQKDLENMRKELERRELDKREELDKEELSKKEELDKEEDIAKEDEKILMKEEQVEQAKEDEPVATDDERRRREKEEEQKKQNFQWGPTDSLADKGVKDLVASGPQHQGGLTTEDQDNARAEQMRADMAKYQEQVMRRHQEEQKEQEQGRTL